MDFALLNVYSKGDIVVTQDYGVAAMILGKGAYGIHQSGKQTVSCIVRETGEDGNRRINKCRNRVLKKRGRTL